MSQVVLIGPMAAGKSSVATLLAERTGRRNVPLDMVRWAYYFKAGFDLAEQRRREHESGRLGRLAYWKPFEAHAVERVLADFPDAIIDFGAGHSVYDDEQLLARVQVALAPVPHVSCSSPRSDWTSPWPSWASAFPPRSGTRLSGRTGPFSATLPTNVLPRTQS
jgi:hypothetical protein